MPLDKDIVPMSELPNNSNKARNEEPEETQKKEVKKVISGTVVRKKRSLIDRASQAVFGQDTKDVISYVFTDILIPSAKNLLYDMLIGGIEMRLFGKVHGRLERSSRDRRSRISYDSMYRGPIERETNRRDFRRQSEYRFEEFVIPERADAEEALASLIDLIDKYDSASVADFLNIIGERPEYPDSKYGWTNLQGASVERVRDGYILILPRTRVIEDL